MTPWATTTYITGRLITHTDLNTLRDDFLMLGTHNHGSSTGSGAGTAEIGPLPYVTFRDGSAPATATGTHTRVFTTAGTFGWVATDEIYLAANATHVHSAM